MIYTIFPKKVRTALLILFVCLFPLASIAQADPGPMSDGVVISAEVSGAVSLFPPTVTTDEPLAIVGETTATLLGTVTDSGDSTVVLEGFHYGLSGIYGTTTTSSGSFGTGPFSANITGLVCGTTYHYQAYAANTAGPSTGSDEVFTTDTCPIVPPPVESPGGGAVLITSSAVNFSGIAYPGATVTILRDGVSIMSTIAGLDGAFAATASGIGAGAYVFSVYAKDLRGVVSAASSFPFVLNGRSIVNISGILVAPTLDIDRVAVQLSDRVTISGYAAPNSTVVISSRQFAQVFAVHANAFGAYSYALSASTLPTGAYTVHSVATVAGQASRESRGRMFLVGLSSVKPGTTPAEGGCRAGDLDCDGRVDIVDYSIMKYWYKKPNPPKKVDLSGDGTVNLKDFSILASEWTG